MRLRAIGLMLTLALGIFVAPLAAGAQPQGKVPHIGILIPTLEADTPQWEQFRQGLRESGYMEGHNIVLEYRFAAGRPERFPDLAAELVRLNVDVIVAVGVIATRAAKNATSTIPILQVAGGDPVAAGLVASLAHPGGNVTGLPLMPGPSLGKVLELLKEAIPGASRVAVLGNPAGLSLWLTGIEGEAQALGFQLKVLEVREPQEFDSAFSTIAGRGIDAVVVPLDPMVYKHRTQIVELATKNRLPTISTDRSFADVGALMTYGVKLPALFQRAGVYAGKILKGTKPADLPVEQPMKFELIINLKTAQALGLTIPPVLLFQADEVIR
jgi:ABC-type uncharacterized transport system substrate-binding protein